MLQKGFWKTKTFVLITHVTINVESYSDASCRRTDQFIRVQVQWQPQAVTLSYLNPYKPGSPSSTTTGLDKTIYNNQDRTGFNIHATYYIKFADTIPSSEYEIKLLQTEFDR